MNGESEGVCGLVLGWAIDGSDAAGPCCGDKYEDDVASTAGKVGGIAHGVASAWDAIVSSMLASPPVAGCKYSHSIKY